MSTEIFNPNPTIFVPVKSKSTYPKPNSLWLDDADNVRDDDLDNDSNEVEEIDQDEIFGTPLTNSTYIRLSTTMLLVLPHYETSQPTGS